MEMSSSWMLNEVDFLEFLFEDKLYMSADHFEEAVTVSCDSFKLGNLCDVVVAVVVDDLNEGEYIEGLADELTEGSSRIQGQ
jgi:hypothetical protein